MKFKKRATEAQLNKLLVLLLEYAPKDGISEAVADEWLENPEFIKKLLEPLCRVPMTRTSIEKAHAEAEKEKRRAEELKNLLREQLPGPCAAEAFAKLSELLDMPSKDVEESVQRFKTFVGFLNERLMPEHATEAIRTLYDLLGLSEIMESAVKQTESDPPAVQDCDQAEETTEVDLPRRHHELEKDAFDAEILADLGGEDKAKVSRAGIRKLTKLQESGQDGPLLANGCTNLFYVCNAGGLLLAQDVRWIDGGWRVAAYSAKRPFSWSAGTRVFCR